MWKYVLAIAGLVGIATYGAYRHVSDQESCHEAPSKQRFGFVVRCTQCGKPGTPADGELIPDEWGFVKRFPSDIRSETNAAMINLGKLNSELSFVVCGECLETSKGDTDDEEESDNEGA